MWYKTSEFLPPEGVVVVSPCPADWSLTSYGNGPESVVVVSPCLTDLHYVKRVGEVWSACDKSGEHHFILQVVPERWAWRPEATVSERIGATRVGDASVDDRMDRVGEQVAQLTRWVANWAKPERVNSWCTLELNVSEHNVKVTLTVSPWTRHEEIKHYCEWTFVEIARYGETGWAVDQAKRMVDRALNSARART